ncbi:MAG: hypothetical protein AAF514_04120 [Verrucomicrobiota bacterium]
MKAVIRLGLCSLLGLVLGWGVSLLMRSEIESEAVEPEAQRTVATVAGNKLTMALSKTSSLAEVERSLVEFASADRFSEEAEWRLCYLIFSLPDAEVPGVLDLLKDRRPFAEETLARALFSRWAEFDPHGALEAAGQFGNASLQGGVEYEVNRAWIATAPEEALAWFKENSRGRESDRQVLDFFRTYGGHDPKRAFELAGQEANPRKRIELENQVLSAMEWFDPEGALHWIMTERTGEDRWDPVNSVLGSWARRNPDRVFDLIETLPSTFEPDYEHIGGGIARMQEGRFQEWLTRVPEEHRTAFLGGGFYDMVYHHATEVMELAGKLPEGRHREQVFRKLAGRLGTMDVALASKWLGGLEPSRSRDLAIQEFTTHLSETDPEAAAIWAADIGNSGKRETALQSVLKRWIGTNEREAEEWMGEHSDLVDGISIP